VNAKYESVSIEPFKIAFAEVYLQTAAVADVHRFSAVFDFFCSLREKLFCLTTDKKLVNVV